jgi:hypothetical protein
MNKKRNLKILFLKLIFLGAGSAAFAATQDVVPVTGTNANGETIVVEVPQKEYSERLRATTSTVNDSFVEAIDMTSKSATQWHLRTIGVGLGVNMEFGIGNMKIGALPRVRLLFTNSTNPPLP